MFNWEMPQLCDFDIALEICCAATMLALFGSAVRYPYGILVMAY